VEKICINIDYRLRKGRKQYFRTKDTEGDPGVERKDFFLNCSLKEIAQKCRFKLAIYSGNKRNNFSFYTKFGVIDEPELVYDRDAHYGLNTGKNEYHSILNFGDD